MGHFCLGEHVDAGIYTGEIRRSRAPNGVSIDRREPKFVDVSLI